MAGPEPVEDAARPAAHRHAAGPSRWSGAGTPDADPSTIVSAA